MHRIDLVNAASHETAIERDPLIIKEKLIAGDVDVKCSEGTFSVAVSEIIRELRSLRVAREAKA